MELSVILYHSTAYRKADADRSECADRFSFFLAVDLTALPAAAQIPGL